MKYLLSILLIIPLLTFSQKVKLFDKSNRTKHFWVRQSITVTSALYAGWCDMEIDVIKHNWHNYLNRFPNTNPYWSNPVLSDNNKWKNRDPNQGEAYWLSSRQLIMFVDKFHMNKFKRNICTFGIILPGTISSYKKFNWKQTVWQSILHYTAFTTGGALCNKFYKI